MKLVIAIIKPSRLEEVRQALNSLDVHGMTVTEVKGYGRQKGHSEIYRGTEYAVHFLPKLKIEIAVDDSQSDAIVTAIRDSAQTGRIGDGYASACCSPPDKHCWWCFARCRCNCCCRPTRFRPGLPRRTRYCRA